MGSLLEPVVRSFCDYSPPYYDAWSLTADYPRTQDVEVTSPRPMSSRRGRHPRHHVAKLNEPPTRAIWLRRPSSHLNTDVVLERMCGRYTQFASWQEIHDYFNLLGPAAPFRSAKPTQGAVGAPARTSWPGRHYTAFWPMVALPADNADQL